MVLSSSDPETHSHPLQTQGQGARLPPNDINCPYTFSSSSFYCWELFHSLHGVWRPKGRRCPPHLQGIATLELKLFFHRTWLGGQPLGPSPTEIMWRGEVTCISSDMKLQIMSSKSQPQLATVEGRRLEFRGGSDVGGENVENEVVFLLTVMLVNFSSPGKTWVESTAQLSLSHTYFLDHLQKKIV